MQKFFFNDWQILMAAVQFWMHGGDPYGSDVLLHGQTLHAGAFAYPPPFLLLGAPLALLPWVVSGLLLLIVGVVSFEYWARQTSGRIALPWLILWLPLFQGIWLGQVQLLVVAGLALAERSYVERHDWRVGLLLALTFFKPQAILLAAVWLLLLACWQRRWNVIIGFALVSFALWGGIALISGLHIYELWFAGLQSYAPDVPNRPLIALPFGPVLVLLSVWIWWRYGRNDVWGVLLLLNTLVYPFSLPYLATAVAFVVIRWKQDHVWYPLVLSWFIPLFASQQRTVESVVALTQLIVMTGLLAAVCPALPWRSIVLWSRTHAD